jgi:5-hydroxyisourate hydrolase-like protein (transthyretin family)
MAAATLAAVPAQAAGTGHITGTVTGSSGQALAGVTVSAYQSSFGAWEEVANTDTSSSGDYDLSALPDGAYRLGFYDKQGASAGEYWDNKPTLDEAAAIQVVSGQTVAGKNAQLAAGGHLTGTVTGPTGEPLPDVEVTAYPSQAVGDVRVYVEIDDTDAQGRFDISRLPAGSYRLGFRDGSNSYATEYWSDKPTLESANDIVVAAQATVTGRDAQLASVSMPATEVPTATATPTTPLTAATVSNTQLPYVSGLTRVPSKLRVNTGAWSPGGVTLTYQWVANGKPIKGATGSGLKLKAAQIGKRISVQVTAAAPGHQPGTVTSAVTKKIKPRKPAG